jgi:hypothetical protein
VSRMSGFFGFGRAFSWRFATLKNVIELWRRKVYFWQLFQLVSHAFWSS